MKNQSHRNDSTPTRISIVDADRGLASVNADAIVLPIDEDWETRPAVHDLASSFAVDVTARLQSLGSRANPARTLSLPRAGRPPAWVICVGVRRDLPRPVAYRLAGVEAASQLPSARSIGIYAPAGDGGRALGCLLLEGLILGSYGRSEGMRKFEAAERDGADDTRRALTIGRAVNWCRELVDTPSSDLTPAGLASAAAEMADSLGLWHRTWSAADLQEQRIAGICAVGRGASNPPCMAEIRLERGSGPTTVLIGKGVTCDTGGLQIKTADHEWLKADMAGAATVLAATRAAAELGLRADLRVFVPCVENMPGPNAYRTGDLITHRDGTTTEVADTDAEGRLVLADVISLAREDDPAAIIDVATLTDGTALGPDLWPFVTNSELLASAITDAAERSGEPAW